MGRSPCCSKVGLRRGPWSTNEDTLLSDYIHLHGEGNWRSLPKHAGLLRCGKSCRLRWMNYLKPGIKRGNITQDEEDLIVRLHGLLGNRWSLIAGRLQGRTDNEIKNYWNTHLLKKLQIQSKPPIPRKKKKKSQSKVSGAAEEAAVVAVSAPKAKVYLPKPIRVSTLFTRGKSCDSLSSGGSLSSGSDGGEKVAAEYVPVMWPSLMEVEDAGCVLPLLADHCGGDVELLDQVYDEYWQLLNFD